MTAQLILSTESLASRHHRTEADVFNAFLPHGSDDEQLQQHWTLVAMHTDMTQHRRSLCLHL